MKRLFALLFITPMLLVSQYTYNYLQIQHPQQTWRYGQGTISQALVSVHPKGNYLQYDMYLTFSANTLGFTVADSVEVQMEFSLPQGAIVNDLWLWIDSTTIMKGLILDRWTASNIYENIVKRRRDPALLMKNSDLQYSLRIYPMAGNSSRKVRISYLLPAAMSGKNLSTSIPTNIFRLSKVPMAKATVFYWPDQTVIEPRFAEVSGAFEAAPRTDLPSGKKYYYGEIPSNYFSNTVTLMNTNSSGSTFVGKYENPFKPGEGYFQVSFNPSSIFNITTAQKIVFLFEFNEAHSAYSTLSLVNSMKTFMLANMTKKDSFNLIFSGTQIKRMKNTGWIPADSSSIITTFDLVTQNLLQNASNTQALISDGIDFIRNNGNSGAIWLVAGSEGLNVHTVVNPAIQSLSEQLKPVIPIHIMDVSNYSVIYSYFNNKYYYGNDYFYENLSRITGSMYTGYRINSSLQSNMQSVYDQIRGTIKSFDMITRIENGFCSNRFTNITTSSGDISIDRTITQIGRFNGQFPFILEIAGIYRNQTVTAKVTIHDSNAVNLDNSVETIWAGNYITSLEALPVSNANTKSIIDASLSYRVLSKYSAFLALEPNDSLKACLTCRDETKLLGVNETAQPLIPGNDSLITAYPNPFNPETKLRITLPSGVKAQESSLMIFNMLGQVVRTFDIASASSAKYTEYVWNGQSDNGTKVSSGVYFAVLRTPAKHHTVKLVFTK